MNPLEVLKWTKPGLDILKFGIGEVKDHFELRKLKKSPLEQKNRALLQAAADTDYKYLFGALEAGAQVDTRDGTGRTALMLVSYEARTDLAAILIEKGANPDALDTHHMCALSYASRRPDSKNARVVKLLLDHGANPEVVDRRGMTPLAYATMEGNVTVVRTLLNARVTPVHRLPSGQALTQLASARGYNSIERLLTKAERPLVKKMTRAYVDGDKDKVSDLLRKGVNPNTKAFWFRWSILTQAANKGDLETVKLLVEHGVTVTKEAVRIAKNRKHSELVKYLEFRKDAPEKYNEKRDKVAKYLRARISDTPQSRQ